MKNSVSAQVYENNASYTVDIPVIDREKLIETTMKIREAASGLDGISIRILREVERDGDFLV